MIRLHRLHLENYIGLYNGMGIHEITIDFTKTMHNICIIKGDNGVGKSTIFKALTYNNDSAKDFIPGLPAKKEISYFFDDGTTLFIEYDSKVDDKGNRKNSTCHVIKQLPDGKHVDLNPNGNINEGKEIIYNELDIDASFLLLSQLSSDDRGLADKTPSDRKKFINSKITELDAFNVMYKKLTKKSSELKSMVSSLSSKIESIGNVEQIQNTIKTMENTLGELEDKKALLIATIAANKEKYSVLNKDGDIIQHYNKLQRELDDINTIFSAKKDILNFDDSSNIEVGINSRLAKLENKLENIDSKVKEIDIRRTGIFKDIQDKQIKMGSIGDMELINSTQQRITELESNLQSYIGFFKSIGFENYDIVSESEYEMAIQYVDRINEMIDDLRQEYDMDTIDKAFQSLYSYEEICTEERLHLLELSLVKNKEILSGQNTLKEACKNFDTIPSDCNHKSDCPFINSIVNAKSSLLPDKDYETLEDNIAALETDISQFKADMEEEKMFTRCIVAIKQILNNIPYSILSKFPNTEWLASNESVMKNVMLGSNIKLNTKIYFEHKNLISLIKSSKEDIKNLKDKLSGLVQNKDMIDMLSEDITKLRAEYANMSSAKESYITEFTSLSRDIEAAKIELERFNSMKAQKEQLNALVKRQKVLVEDVPKLARDYDEAKRINEMISRDMTELQDLNMNTISKIQDEISSYKYKIVLYNDYRKEYNEYTSMYNKIEKIRYYTSPTTGIQTIFMEMYMNGIISVSNDLLKMFFGGEYVLHPFVINEKEFRMPCLGKGIMNDDISSMSTSQVCMISMILSFALLRQSSTSYGIIKIDEIDGGLDTQNRLKFIVVLNKLMEVLNYSQCVMISHNTELGMYDADIIVLKNTDPNLKLDGNVIFDINEGIA